MTKKTWQLIIASVIWATMGTALVHWLGLKDDEPFFSLNSGDVSTFITALLIALFTYLPLSGKRMDACKRNWNQFWQNKWVLLISSLFLVSLPVGMLASGMYSDGSIKQKILFWVSLVLFGTIFILALREVIGRKQAPQYDTDQHYLYLIAKFKRTPLEWKHITGFRIVEVEQMGHKKMIAVLMDNIEEQRANETRQMWRLSYDMFVPQYGTPYFIPTERCVLTPEQLLGQLQIELHRHQRG